MHLHMLPVPALLVALVTQVIARHTLNTVVATVTILRVE